MDWADADVTPSSHRLILPRPKSIPSPSKLILPGHFVTNSVRRLIGSPHRLIWLPPKSIASRHFAITFRPEVDFAGSKVDFGTKLPSRIESISIPPPDQLPDQTP